MQGFNFILSFTWPALLDAFGPQGAFGWYAAWNVFATFYTYFLLPETKVSCAPDFSGIVSCLRILGPYTRGARCCLQRREQGACQVLLGQTPLVPSKVHPQARGGRFPGAVPARRRRRGVREAQGAHRLTLDWPHVCI